MNSGSKTAICIQGGGGNGRFAAEALREMTLAGFTFDAAYGVSVGGIVCALASTLGALRTTEIWDNKISNFFDVFSPRLFNESGLVNMAPLQRLLIRYLTGEVARNPYTVGMTDWDTGRYHDVRCDNHPKLIETLLASAAIPVLVKPVANDGIINDPSITEFCDGGTTRLTPLRSAIRDGFEKIVVICCQPNTEGLPTFKPIVLPLIPEIQLIQRAARALEILMHQAMLDDLVWVDAGVPSEVVVVAPRVGWSSLDFTPETNQLRIAEAKAVVAMTKFT